MNKNISPMARIWIKENYDIIDSMDIEAIVTHAPMPLLSELTTILREAEVKIPKEVKHIYDIHTLIESVTQAPASPNIAIRDDKIFLTYVYALDHNVKRINEKDVERACENYTHARIFIDTDVDFINYMYKIRVCIECRREYSIKVDYMPFGDWTYDWDRRYVIDPQKNKIVIGYHPN